MLKALFTLCQAALLVGMVGVAPYAAGHCARYASDDAGAPMRGMSHGRADQHGHTDQGGRAPAPVPRHHSCCGGCLGPCSSAVLLGLPAAAPAVAVASLRLRAFAASPDPAAVNGSPRLLPFANGPPHHLG